MPYTLSESPRKLGNIVPDLWNHDFVKRMVLSVFLLIPGYCQSQILSLETYSMKNGLPSNNINTIYQDSRGVMWFGTTNGLSIYDGQSFRNFTTQHGLADNSIHEIIEDRNTQGKMWLLSLRHLCVMVNGRVTRTLSIPGARAIYQDSSGIVWCGTLHGLVKINEASVERYSASILDTLISGIVEVGDSLLWFASDMSVISYNRNSRMYRRYDTRRYNDGIIWSIMADKSGDVWVGISDGLMMRFRDTSLVGIQDIGHTASALKTNNQGTLWFGGYGGIGWITSRRFSKAKPIKYSIDNGLTENTIRSLFIDREGNLWIGGRDNGVMKMPVRPVLRFPLEHISMFAISHNNRYAVSDTNNHIWVVSERALKEFWRDETGKWYSHVFPHRTPVTVSSLFVDAQNRLWIMESRRGWYYATSCYKIELDPHSGRSRLFPVQHLEPWTYVGYPINLAVSGSGLIWQAGSGLLVRSSNGRSLRLFNDSDRVPTNYLREVFEDRKGNIWCGTFFDGVVKITSQGMSGYTITPLNSTNGFPRDGVWSIYEDRFDNMLFGTQLSGLVSLRNGIMTQQTTNEGLPSNLIYCMTEGKDGRLWLGTGVGMVYEASAGSRKFVQRNAMLGSEVFHCGTTRDGLIWYCTANDLYVFDPQTHVNETVSPSVHLKRIIVNGVAMNYSPELSLPHDQNNIEIAYIGIHFAEEKELRYQYRLRGYRDTWSDLTESHSATYGNLNPGSYVFEVRAVSNEGVRSMSVASLVLFIRAPFWKQSWFIITISMVLASLLFWSYRWRIDRIRKKELVAVEFSQRLISQQESERKRIAHELHDVLGQEFIVISNRARKAMKTHDKVQITRQLDSISQSASRALESVREIALNLSPYHLEHFGLITTIRGMVQRILDTSNITVTVETEVNDASISKHAQIHVYRIIQEAFNNILKHSGATSVFMSLKTEHDGLRIRIIDNGKGFKPALTTGHDAGMGIRGLKERARLLGGSLMIESSPGQGTTLTAHIPSNEDWKINGNGMTEESEP